MTDLEKKENQKKSQKLYYENNKEKRKESVKNYFEKNKNKMEIYYKNYREENKEKIKTLRQNKKDELKEYTKQWRENNKEYNKKYYENNKNKIKQYYNKNKEKINKYQNIYQKQKREINPLYKLITNIRTRIYMSLKAKGYTKKSKTFETLGCSYEDFKQHLERQFTKGMTWDNLGQWHLDHIIPVSLAKDEQELIRLNHYTNFQPLWAKDNLEKHNKIIPNTQIKLI
jgi:hypothetical protein